MADQSHDRAELWRIKAGEWARELIQLDARNALLNFKLTKTSTLDLGSCPDHVVSRLLAGNQVRLSELFTEDETYRDACTRARGLARKIRGFSEEQGVDVGRIIYGRVISGRVKRGGARAPVALRAPLLLYQLTLQARTAAENDFALQLEPEPEINPVLRHCLQREYDVRLESEDLERIAAELGERGEADQFAEKYFGLISESSAACGVELDLESMVAVGICNYTKLPMVDDLMSATRLLEQHDLVAALAGLPVLDADNADQQPYTSKSPDEVPPRYDHLVLDADSSQHRAIATALADRNVVIDGPPGTGKSQTIANIIAGGAAVGRKILFVAEKRAAIEAVTDRLTDIGLDSLVLDLHRSKNSSRAVAVQLNESFEKLRGVPVAGGEALDRELEDTRRRLNEYVDALHNRREPWGVSAYQVRENLVRLSGSSEKTLRLHGLQRFTPATRHEVTEDLRCFVANGGLRLIRRESPWWRAQVATVDDARVLRDRLDAMTASTLRDSQSSMRALVAEVGLPEPRDFQEWERTLHLLGGMAGSAATLGPDIFRGPLDEYRVAAARWVDRRKMMPKVGWRRRSRLVKELRRNTAGITKKSQLSSEIAKVLGALGEWRRMSGAVEGPGRIGDLGSVSHKYGQLRDQLAAIAMSAGVVLDEQPLDAIDRELNVLAADRDMLPFLPDLNARLERLRIFGLNGLLNEVAERNLDPEQSVAVFHRALMNSLDDEFILTARPLREFRADSHDQVLERFGLVDRRHQDLAVRRVLRCIAERAQQASTEHPAEWTLLRSEAKKKRGHRRLRKLVTDAGHIMLAVRPCWAMSPLEVSRLLPAEQLFDLVIFDEASQVQPHDAITAIMRGRRLVVAGDDKQLPPTSFFERHELDDGDSDDDTTELRDYESILTTLQPRIPDRCRLQWHYRSQDERLIWLSNEEMYNRELVTFPGARAANPVRLEVVDGRVQPGERGSAYAEIERVVELVIDHAQNRPHESLGVITLGLVHQRKLDMALRRAREDHPELAEFFAEDRGPTKRFFSKNIETVQGDERDAIILSVGVAKNANGGVERKGFAVLNQEGTERRINVAITRAKRRMTVVSSFAPGALEPTEAGKMTGTEFLRRYLEAADRGGAIEYVGRRKDAELNGFEQAIYDALVARGVDAVPQWGVSEYRIDLALPHPEEPGRMILAVEADGDTYHRSASARDRDRLRQQQLEQLGWQFHRVWASAWFSDPDGELERIMVAWKDAVAISDSSMEVEAPAPERSLPEYVAEGRPALPRPEVQPGMSIDRHEHAQLVAMFVWRMSDGLLPDVQERIRQVRIDLGFKRRGRRIDERLQKAFDEAQRLRDEKDL